jgi:FkbM family methyltransferase
MKRRLYSQAGQDLWVARDVFGFMPGGYFVDIGAADGVALSNSYALEKYLGWNGVCIEASPRAFARLQQRRNCRCLNVCLDETPGEVRFVEERGFFGGIVGSDTDNPKATAGGAVITLPTRVLGELLEAENAPSMFDYLSLDVEGAEERVMRGFPFDRYAFRCATIERPSPALRQLLSSHGYWLVAELPGLDCFYLHESMKNSYVVRAQEAANERARGGMARLLHSSRMLFREGVRARLRRW